MSRFEINRADHPAKADENFSENKPNAEIKRLMSKINLVYSEYIKTNNKDANQKIAAMAKRVRNLCSMIVLLNIFILIICHEYKHLAPSTSKPSLYL